MLQGTQTRLKKLVIGYNVYILNVLYDRQKIFFNEFNRVRILNIMYNIHTINLSYHTMYDILRFPYLQENSQFHLFCP